MRFYGDVGFVKTVETEPGMWESETTLKPYYGDVLRNNRRYQPGDKINSDLVIENEISIVADKFAYENIGAMRFVNYLNVNWEVSSVQVEPPRLLISLGGVYIGDTTGLTAGH